MQVYPTFGGYPLDHEEDDLVVIKPINQEYIDRHVNPDGAHHDGD